MATVTGNLSRALRRISSKRPVTIDDATEFLERTSGKADVDVIRSVLRRPKWRPVAWIKTNKASRHGRPVRGWKPVDSK